MAEIKNPIVTHTNPKSPVSEAYRVLRTNIQFSSVDKPLKTIVVTSSGPFEGKTTTIANIAITFAQMGSRVLLIDADLRKPRIHKVFNLLNMKGLTNYLAHQDDYKDYLSNSPVENLDIMPCGIIPPNPSEILNSNAMRTFVETVRDEYDLVLLDSPPVIQVTDAAILSVLVDGTILVAASGKVVTKALLRTKELLEKVNAKIIGVVVNKMSKKAKTGYYTNMDYYSRETGRKSKRKKDKQESDHSAPAV